MDGDGGLTENCVDQVVGFFQGGVEIVGEWDVEVLELGCETLGGNQLVLFYLMG